MHANACLCAHTFTHTLWHDMKWNDMIWCDVKGNDMTWWFYDMNIRCTMLYDRLYDTSCTAYRNRMYIRYYDIRCLMYDVCYMMYLMWYDPTLEHMYLYILAYASSMQMRVWDTTILGPNLSKEKTGHHRVSSTLGSRGWSCYFDWRLSCRASKFTKTIVCLLIIPQVGST